jgi:prepilin-type N-terminal cleavage/methylation domain-containing protein
MTLANPVERRGGFTLVELLATIAIMAVLIVAALPYVADYTEWARQTIQQQNLLVLNDALTRYKCEGGSLVALTQGAPIGDVIAAMKQPLTWGGTTHNVMQAAFTVPARSLYATGSGSSYQFVQFGSYYAPVAGGFGGNSSHGVQSFTTVGAATWTVPAGVSSVEVLVVAGGGGGAGVRGAGGGAGGVIHQASYSVTAGNSITVTVGSGGAGGGGSGSNGANSMFGSLTAIGGGYGGNGDVAGGNGGSGGGAGGQWSGASGGTGTVGQGNNGGNNSMIPTGSNGAGGGGGAGTPGGDGVYFNQGGKGGDGLQFSISGTPTYYGGGGGCGGYNVGIGGLGGGGGSPGGDGTDGFPGTPNTGGGGGGAWSSNNGGAGGSGIVIVKY